MSSLLWVPFSFNTHLTLGYKEDFHFSPPLQTLTTDSADAEVDKNRACVYGMYNAYMQLGSMVDYLQRWPPTISFISICTSQREIVCFPSS